MRNQRPLTGPYKGALHAGGETVYSLTPASLTVHPARAADDCDCPHYAACLAHVAAGPQRKGATPRSVCRPGCGHRGPPKSLTQIVADACRTHGVRQLAVRGNVRDWHESQARHDVWTRGNAEGYSDEELGRVTGCLPATVTEWLDKPRSRR